MLCLLLTPTPPPHSDLQGGNVIPLCETQSAVTGRDIRVMLDAVDPVAESLIVIAVYFIFFRVAAYLALRLLKHNSTGRS